MFSRKTGYILHFLYQALVSSINLDPAAVFVLVAYFFNILYITCLIFQHYLIFRQIINKMETNKTRMHAENLGAVYGIFWDECHSINSESSDSNDTKEETGNEENDEGEDIFGMHGVHSYLVFQSFCSKRMFRLS